MSDSDLTVADENKLIVVPQFAVNTVQVASNGVDVVITFSRLVPTNDDAGVGLTPACALSMSRGAAVELSVVLAELSEKLSSDLGEIDTPFLRERRKKS